MKSDIIAVTIGCVLPALFYGVGGIFQKASFDRGAGIIGYLRNVAMGTWFTGAIWIVLGGAGCWSVAGFAWAFLSGFAYGGAGVLIGVAIRQYAVPLALLTVLNCCYFFVPVAAGLLWYGEAKGFQAWPLACAICAFAVGSTLVALARKERRSSPGTADQDRERRMDRSFAAIFRAYGVVIGGIGPAVLYGVVTVAQKEAFDTGISVGSYLAFLSVGIMTVGLVWQTILPRDHLSVSQTGNVLAAYVGVCYGLANGLVGVGLQVFDVSLVVLSLVTNFYFVPPVAYGLLWLREWKQFRLAYLIAGVVLAIFGSVTLALARIPNGG